jgi:hypothetical protein
MDDHADAAIARANRFLHKNAIDQFAVEQRLAFNGSNQESDIRFPRRRSQSNAR